MSLPMFKLRWQSVLLWTSFCTLMQAAKLTGLSRIKLPAPGRDTRCYGELGCFNIGGPFHHPVYRPINFYPSERHVVDTQFLFYTRENPMQEDLLRWSSTLDDIRGIHFNASRGTKVIVHGLLDTLFFATWLTNMKTAFLLAGDYNVIIVDWRGGNGLPYSQATANTRLVGAEIAVLINKLEDIYGAKPESFHILGHSLGAHVAGYAGERLKTLGRITGMDPAEPYFQKMPKEVRVDPTDADFVDIVHTDGASFVPAILKGEGLGMFDPTGHVDFYPNGGIKMPGCDLGSRIFHFVTEGLVQGARAIMICHHQRAVDYVLESITDTQCMSLAYECSSYEMFRKGRCSDCGSDGSRCAPMGYRADRWKRFKNDTVSRRMFLDTNSVNPYCSYHYLVNVQMSLAPDAVVVTGDLYLTLEGTKGKSTIQINRGTVELYPGAKYTFVASTPDRVGVIKKSWFTFRSNHFLFKPRMFLKHIELLFMNRPTSRTEKSTHTKILCPAAPNGLSSDSDTLLSDC